MTEQTPDTVLRAAMAVDRVYVEYSTFTMPKALREALNTLHQVIAHPAGILRRLDAQGSFDLKE
jgi:hypothetical protein